MGGSTTKGNVYNIEEFNIYIDSKAAKIVFSNGFTIVMAGMDVGQNALVYTEDSAQLKDMNHTGNMFYHLFKKYRGGSFNQGLIMYDSCAIAYLLKPDLFETADTFVDIELQGEYTRGATIVDIQNYFNKQSNVKVCKNINEEEFKNWYMENIKNCI